MYGYAPGELDGKPTAVLYSDLCAHASAMDVYQTLARGETSRRVEQRKRKDGTLFWTRADGRAVEAPAIVERQDVWARNQLVTALVVPDDRIEQGVYQELPRLYQLIDTRYRQHVLERMFASRPDTLLRDSLARNLGFSLLVPNLYRFDERNGSYVFRTVSEMGAQLMRTVLVTWREGVIADPTPEYVLAWRDSVAQTLYDPPQQTNRERYETRLVAESPHTIEVHGSWSAQSNGWPFGGPFVARAVPCPAQNRTYLLDAWVHAPAQPKYQYLIQFEILLDTFVCAP
jgi:hypothetical protein